MGLSLKKIGGALGAVAGTLMGGNTATGYTMGSGLGSLFDKDNTTKNDRQYQQSLWNNQFNTAADFEREKAQNAHQWEIEDLKKAGLNPVLSAMGSTAGAIAGGGAPNPGQIPEYTGARELGRINSGLKAMEIYQNAQKQMAEIENIHQETTGKALDNDLVRKYGDKKMKRALANMVIEGEMNKSTTARNVAEANEIAAGTAPVERENKFWDEHPNLYKFKNFYEGVRTPIKDVLSLGGLALGATKLVSTAKGVERAMSTPTRTEHFDRRGRFRGATVTTHN